MSKYGLGIKKLKIAEKWVPLKRQSSDVNKPGVFVIDIFDGCKLITMPITMGEITLFFY